MKAIQIYTRKGQRVGEVIGDTFYKRIKTKHFLQQPPGLGFDRSTLVDAQAAGANRAEIINIDNGKIYRASFEIIIGKGISIDRGYGAQICLPLGYWDVDGGDVDPPKAIEPEAEQIAQMTLL